MAAIWRPSLPQYAARPGYKVAIGDTRLVGSTESGGDNSRRRSTRRVDVHTFQMFFDDHQREEFLRFWEYDVGGGNLDFWFPAQPHERYWADPTDGKALTDETGLGIAFREWWLVQFVKRQAPPSFDLRGLDWVASIAIGRIA
ncbi:hypothetical protein [Hansschlegelia zhihuaiae]|uniref:Uncharacterized protein n=1 Tax=Hansschlegelia zhihuaiae TaxID=405005 RepID=A0A4Q0MMX1_9HYPH|nr:hypothetical protein [Hansschlegelia zhihuaiae]RXF75084.1 hypothetical protein EK403_03280 [Hansschlegelia zhihuaiae]